MKPNNFEMCIILFIGILNLTTYVFEFMSKFSPVLKKVLEDKHVEFVVYYPDYLFET